MAPSVARSGFNDMSTAARTTATAMQPPSASKGWRVAAPEDRGPRGDASLKDRAGAFGVFAQPWLVRDMVLLRHGLD